MKTHTPWRTFYLPLVLSCSLPAVVRAQFGYDPNPDQTATLVHYAGDGGAVTIPSTINRLTVTKIGNYVFRFNTSVTSIAIPDSVTRMGLEVFRGCSGLTNVTLGNTTTNLGDGAFAGCASLAAVAIVDSVAIIGNYGFSECSSLSRVTMGSGVTHIGAAAFQYCANLTDLTLGRSISNIGGYAFGGCTSLGMVRIPDSVTEVEDSAFSGCSNVTSLMIGKGVTNIGRNAFFGCRGLTNLTIGCGVSNIGEGAFSRCTNSLNSIYFKGDALDLGPFAFAPSYATVYYLPGMSGWGATFGGLRTSPWILPYPLMLKSGSSFGGQSNRFGFIVSWATNLPVVVEASANLLDPVWQPLHTNGLDTGSFSFSNPEWTNYPARFYRVRWP